MRKLNVKLLVGLVVGSVVALGGVYFLHKWQVRRNANSLFTRAQKAEEKGEYDEAMKLYLRFVQHKKDDDRGWEALASAATKAADAPDASITTKFKAYQLLEQTAAEIPENTEVRRQLVDFQMSIGRFGDALTSLEPLIEKVETDHKNGTNKDEAKYRKDLAELDLIRAKCLLFSDKKEEGVQLLSELLGYDPVGGRFAETPGPARDQVDAYTYLAMALREKRETEEQAPAILDRMVAENKDKPQAYLSRGQFYRQDKENDKAEADFAAAAKIAPDDLDVILNQVDAALAKKNYEQTDQLLAKALKDHPRDTRVYRAAIMSAMAQGKVQDGLKLSEDGIKQVTDPTALLMYRAELLLQLRDLEGARSVIRTLKDQGTAPTSMRNYLEAYLKLAEGDYAAASIALEGVRSQVGSGQDLGEHVDILLGQAYLNQKKFDKALDAYDRVLVKDPQSVSARLGRARVEEARGGNRARFNPDLEKLFTESGKGPDGEGEQELSDGAKAQILGRQLDAALEEQAERSEAQRDWKRVDQVMAQLVPLLNPKQKGVLEAQVLISKGQFAAARKILDVQKQQEPKDLATWLAVANLEFSDKGADAAMAALGEAEQQLGDVVPVRLGRLSILNRLPRSSDAERDALAARLKAQEQGLDKFKGEDQKNLLLALGGAYLQLLKVDDTVRLWQQAAGIGAGDPAIRLAIFELARDRGNEPAMDAALAEIKKTVGPASDEALFAEASRILWSVKKQKLDQAALATALAPAQEKITTLRSRRENWDKLAGLAAEVELLQNNMDQAQDSLTQAVRNNPGNVVALGQLFRLLVTQRKFQEARRHIAALGPGPHSPTMNKLIAEVEEATAHPDEAAKAAAAAVPDDSQVYEDLVWRAGLLKRLQKEAEAEKLLKRAVQAAPDRLDPWLSLAEFCVLTKQPKKVDALVKQSESKLSPEQHELFQAMAHEALGRLNEADQLYQQILAKRPDDVMALRGAASFAVRAKRNAEAVKYLDQMLAAAAKDPKHAEDLAWARRVKAQQVGATGDYTEFLAALDSLDQSAKGGPLGPQEKVLKAMLLAQRPEPQSWMAGMAAFDEISKDRPLLHQEKWLLALLEQKAGDLPKARELLLEALAQDPGNVDYLGSYVKILLDQNDPDEAIKWVDKLQELKPLDLKVYLLKAEVLSKQGKKAQAVAMLKRMIPQKITDENAHYLREVAGLCEAFEQFDEAQQLYEEYAQKNPAAGALYLAGYLGRRGKVDESFVLLQKVLRKNTVLPISELAIAILRANQAKLTPAQLTAVDKWIRQGLTVTGASANGEPNPGEFVLKLRQAELRDLQGQYDEVMKLYEELLNRSDIDDKRKAIVLNNLSFLLAVKTGDGDRALKMVDDAIKTLGPTSDLLDTRAMAHLARGDSKNAIADLTLALNGSVEPMKLFHLALAYSKAGDKEKANEAWQQAKEKKFDPNQLSEPERKLYDQLLAAIGS